MTGRETEFIPNYPLFFTHKGRRVLFELLGVKTQKQFMNCMNELERGDGVPDEVYEKIVFAGLIWKYENITLNEIPALLEIFYRTGKSFEDLDTLIIDAYVNSGLYNKDIVQAFRMKRDQEMKDAINRLFGIEEKEIKEVPEPEPEGEDTGEQSKKSKTLKLKS